MTDIKSYVDFEYDHYKDILALVYLKNFKKDRRYPQFNENVINDFAQAIKDDIVINTDYNFRNVDVKAIAKDSWKHGFMSQEQLRTA